MDDYRVKNAKPLQVIFVQFGELLPIKLLSQAVFDDVIIYAQLAKECSHLLHREMVKIAILWQSEFHWKENNEVNLQKC